MLEWPPGLLERRAYEDERVLSFDSLIKVEKNGDLLFTERIEARFEGKFIRPFSPPGRRPVGAEEEKAPGGAGREAERKGRAVRGVGGSHR